VARPCRPSAGKQEVEPMKPKPWPGKFASEAEEQEHVLDCLCWFFAKDMSLSLEMFTRGMR
jgi:hypothetical protein